MILFLISCSHKGRFKKNYIELEKEQLAALSLKGDRFLQNRKDLELFVDQLEKEVEKQRVLYKKDKDFYFKAIRRDLKGEMEKGRVQAPFFHVFHGHWQGTWFEGSERSFFDHIWHPPYEKDGYILQKVFISKLNPVDGKTSGTIAAINSYDPGSGYIYGGVDINKEDLTHAPHYGIFVDDNSLVWVARFGEDKELPYYAVFFETVKDSKVGKRYLVKGLGFNFDRASNKLLNVTTKRGDYFLVQ